MTIKCYPNSNGIKDLFSRTNYISRKPIYDFYMEKLSSVTGFILDLGCGDMPYKDIFQAAQYIGLDVDTAKDYGFNKDGVVYYDGRDIPFDDESVDCILSAQVFEHIEDLDYSLKEIRRVLKPGGVLCFSVPMAYPIHYSPYDFRRFTCFGIEKMLDTVGFVDVEIKGSNRPIDSVRFIKITEMPRLFSLPYVFFANLFFLYGLRGEKRMTFIAENLVRRILHRDPKVEDLRKFPLDYLVFCRKNDRV